MHLSPKPASLQIIRATRTTIETSILPEAIAFDRVNHSFFCVLHTINNFGNRGRVSPRIYQIRQPGCVTFTPDACYISSLFFTFFIFFSIVRSMGYTIHNKVTQAGVGMQGLCPQASVFPLPTVCCCRTHVPGMINGDALHRCIASEMRRKI